MAAPAKGWYWAGAITSRAQARNIIRWAGWTFVAVGLLIGLLNGGADGLRASTLAASILFILPALGLLLFNSRVAAGFLAIFNMVVMGIAGWSFTPPGGGQRGAAIWGVVAIFLVLALLSFRAFRAAMTLPRLADDGSERSRVSARRG